MAASSKSSQKTKNVVIALLALWSIISLVVIVVWATSPDMKSSAQCRHELKEANVKLEGSRVMWDKNKIALEEMVEKEREEKDRQTVEIMLLLGRLNATNATLEQCRQEIVVLMGNISVLQENNEQLRQTEANLTAELRLQEDHIELLQENLTQAFHETQSCFSLKTAAESQMLAAQSQTRACESNKQYLQKKLSSCTPKSAVVKPTPPPKPQEQGDDSDSAAPPLAGISALALLMCSALHLITCEYQRRLHPPKRTDDENAPPFRAFGGVAAL